MKIESTDFNGVYIINNFYQFDIRGNFIKVFNTEQFEKANLDVNLHEIYYSTSQKDVIRGMHFQLPPYEHSKIIHVIKGSVIDVILDLRKKSPNYKNCLEIHLTGNKPKSIYIPKGCAHGFRCLENDTIMLYQVTSGYNPESDLGIAYDSIGYDWKVNEPIVSERDNNFITLQDFISPF